MSLPLIVRSKLFWKNPRGQLDCCWYLGWGDGASVAKQDAYLADMDRFGVNAITLNLLNEECSSPFVGEFMNSPTDNRKVDLMFNFIRKLKARGKLVAPVFFDCPRNNPAKYPFWKFTDRLGPFLEVATKALAPLVDGFIVGVETNRSPTIEANRGLSVAEMELAIGLIKQFAFRMDGETRYNIPVGTHEQSYRIPANADFLGWESSNHPFNPQPTPSIVKEVKTLVSKANGKPVWLIETRADEGEECKAQNRILAELPGVVGVGGPM